MTDINEQQWTPRPELAESLRKHGEKSAALGNLAMAGDIHHSIHTLHLTRNQLDRKDNYETKVMFLNGAIKILEKELERNLIRAHTHWLVSRGQHEKVTEEKEALDADTKGPQDNG